MKATSGHRFTASKQTLEMPDAAIAMIELCYRVLFYNHHKAMAPFLFALGREEAPAKYT